MNMHRRNQMQKEACNYKSYEMITYWSEQEDYDFYDYSYITKKVKITQKVSVFSSSEEKEAERNDEEDKYL